MRILYVAYDRPHRVMGPTVNAQRLLPALASAGIEPSVLLLHGGAGAPAADHFRDHGVPVHVARRCRYVRQQIRWFVETVRAARPDVFVPNLSVAGWSASRYIRPAGIPTIAAHRREDPFYESMLDRFVFGDPRDAVSGVVSVSRSVHRRIESAGGSRTSAAWIPSGVPMPADATADRRPFTMLALGRLEGHAKRIGAVVDTMIEVVRRHPATRARIVGDGTAREDLERRVGSAGLTSAFEFVGHVVPGDIPRAVAGTSVILQLSDREGTPGALMDAMAAGVVPVARRCSDGVAELVRDGVDGTLIEPTDDIGQERSLAVDAIERCINAPDRWHAHSTACREQIRAQYSIDSMVDRWIDFLETVRRGAERPGRVRRPWTIPLPPRNEAFDGEDRRRRWYKRVMNGRRIPQPVPRAA